MFLLGIIFVAMFGLPFWAIQVRRAFRASLIVGFKAGFVDGLVEKLCLERYSGGTSNRN